jgi:hypothetical protein
MDNCPKKDCHDPKALIFRKIVIPASVADDRVNPPKPGDYCNQLVVYQASGNAYLFSSDGLPTLMTADVAELAAGLKKETEERTAEDIKIWDEIETIEAASDVVDVVGTYAELQAYDTSKLQDNDLIKVLADETHDGAISYYRWSTSTEAFTYVGSEGPYYTEGQVDTLLSAKQDKLIAGSNIQIASDGKTISATDTTYSAFTGATAGVAGTGGLVPAPAAGDQNKVLKGDGSWGTTSESTIFYANSQETGNTRYIYKAPNMTGTATMQDIIDANEKGQVILRFSIAADPATYSDAYLQNAYVASGDYQMLFLDNRFYYSFDTTATSASAFTFSKRELQTKLTAGSNIQINGNTISATDTTYSDFTGTDGLVAGTHGLVPAPATTDANKYLKSDGTWATVQAGGSSVAYFYWDSAITAMKDIDSQTVDADELFTALGYYDNNGKEVQITEGDSTGVVVSYWCDPDAQIYTEGKFVAEFKDPSTGAINVVEYVYSSESSGGAVAVWSRNSIEVQPKLTAGANISIGTVSNVPNTISVTGMPVLYGSQGQNTDGAVTQKVFTDTVGDVESILQILNSGAGV